MPALTTVECIFSAAAMVFGGFAFGVVIGNITEIIRRANHGSAMPDQKMAEARMMVRIAMGATSVLHMPLTLVCVARCSANLSAKRPSKKY